MCSSDLGAEAGNDRDGGGRVRMVDEVVNIEGGEVHKGVALPSSVAECVVGQWFRRVGGIGAGHIESDEGVSCRSVLCRRNLV